MNKELFNQIREEFNLPMLKVKLVLFHCNTYEECIEFLKNTEPRWECSGMLDVPESQKLIELRKSKR